MNRAIKERWAVTPELKATCLEIVGALLDSEDDNVRIGAVRSIIAMEKQNQDDKLKQRESRVALEQIINMNVQPSAPDPEFLAWKQQKLMDEQRRQAEARAALPAPGGAFEHGAARDGAARDGAGPESDKLGGAKENGAPDSSRAPHDDGSPLARFMTGR